MSKVVLSEFISTTIDEIFKWVNVAKVESTKLYSGTIIAAGSIDGERVSTEQNIEFEIFTETTVESNGKLKIAVVSGQVGDSVKNYQRIKFNIPVLLRGLGKPENKNIHPSPLTIQDKDEE